MDAVPELGEHTAKILAELGHADAGARHLNLRARQGRPHDNADPDLRPLT